MRRTITTFLLQEDSGAVTVDWVVMTAIVTALGALVMVLFVEGDNAATKAIADRLSRVSNE
ncbi:MAG: hypothetical protein ACU0AX_07205 [Roseovarius sp.]|uniref:hypothetical protein n=1 Tax=Roseovarius sp. TaxID=1486281 RepID=UPI004058D71E